MGYLTDFLGMAVDVAGDMIGKYGIIIFITGVLAVVILLYAVVLIITG